MNRNRKWKKAVASTTAVMLSACMVGMPVLTADSAAPEKEETVYVNMDASGNVEKITVSDWLKNNSQSAELSDSSSLSDIKNVKGDETFTQDGEKLTWQADGSDIYYQGTTDKELPVTVKLTYYLDGQENVGALSPKTRSPSTKRSTTAAPKNFSASTAAAGTWMYPLIGLL